MFNKTRPKENILIIGGFRKAKSLSNSLIKKGFNVTVINNSFEDCEKLAEIDELNVIYGDGSKKFILENARADTCQVAIALTDCDEINLVVLEMCKKYFNVKKTVSRLNDPSKTNFFYKMGIDRVVCTLTMITNIMEEQAIMDEMTRMIPVNEEGVKIMELVVSKDSKLTNKKLWELDLPREIIIGCIIRAGKSLIPRGDSRIKEGDVLLVITSDENKLGEMREMMEYA